MNPRKLQIFRHQNHPIGDSKTPLTQPLHFPYTPFANGRYTATITKQGVKPTMFKTLFNRGAGNSTASKIDTINAPELKKRIDAGDPVFLLDVRTSREYEHDGHIPGSRLLPLNALNKRINEIPTDQTIICICRSGSRSKFAAEQLASAGYENVINLSGGMFGWQMSRYPVQ